MKSRKIWEAAIRETLDQWMMRLGGWGPAVGLCLLYEVRDGLHADVDNCEGCPVLEVFHVGCVDKDRPGLDDPGAAVLAIILMAEILGIDLEEEESS